MNVLQATIEECLNCHQCKTACRRLRSFEKRSPGDVAQAVLNGQVDDKVMDFIMKCSLCSLCNELCPYGVDIRGMVTYARNSLMDEGMIDQECYRHLWVDRDWNLFSLFRANYWLDITYQGLVKKNCEVLFFPGCMLVHEGPDLVRHAAEWLRKRHGDGVGISFQCCGAPLEQMGQMERAKTFGAGLWEYILQTGASTLITSCPTCHARMMATRPDCNVQILSLFQLMARSGLRVPLPDSEKITVHDSCSDREGVIGGAVRELLQDCNLVEMEHHGKETICCGSGGLVSAIDPDLCTERALRRLKEAEAAGAETCVTYCMSCSHRLAARGGTSSVRHILELIFDKMVEHEEFDRMVHGLFQGERGEENFLRLQNSQRLFFM
ncbi:MAG: (Fe-S)-binding protein [Deltaproteobacteria bacterium]|nr:(Fe-S)-binding protein [Deltaproteobacteria bacterium]